MRVNRRSDGADLINQALAHAILRLVPLAVYDDAKLILLAELEELLIRRVGKQRYTDLVFAAQRDDPAGQEAESEEDDWLAHHRCLTMAVW
jgi:hypothetical protein